MSEQGVFLKSTKFLAGIQELNAWKDQDELSHVFEELCTRDPTTVVEIAGTSVRQTLSEIVDRVAYFPVRPVDMKTELVVLGLKESLSSELSMVWSKHARTVVNRRKAVNSDLKDVNFEILTAIGTGEERVRLHLRLADSGRTEAASRLLLSLSPSELFGLFDQLETVQSRIDQLCS